LEEKVAESKNVTRIKATDTAAKNTAGDKAVKATKAVKASKVPSKAPKKPRVAKEPSNLITQALFAIGRYFKGAWLELKQVRWPTRKSTWGLTLAVILFSIFFIVIILLLDAFFKFVFELMIK
jgi:preprotein translocase SecE subunit